MVHAIIILNANLHRLGDTATWLSNLLVAQDAILALASTLDVLKIIGII
jgi:hypothetical protein